jgi:hypothetical protein
MFYAHRLSFALANNLDFLHIGGFVLHSCDNRSCANCVHLSLGTQIQNMQQRQERMRHVHGERSPHAKLTEAQVREIRAMAGKVLQKDIALHFGVHPSIVSGIVTRQRWRHVI